MDAALGSGGNGEEASKMLIDDHCSSLIVKLLNPIPPNSAKQHGNLQM
jgi:hypothetical protein